MPIGASGAGRFGSVGTTFSRNKLSQGAVGNSKLMKAQNQASLRSLAESQTRKFIATGKKLSQGAAGNSRISIKA